jgi:uncharacterized protein (DUF305 family)
MKRPVLILTLLLAVVLGVTLIYFAQRDHGRGEAPSTPSSGPSAEMMGAMHWMHGATNGIPMTGDIDRDFVALMVPHHRSAVEMARVYLAHGKDPELRRLSENIVASQEAEIRQMGARHPAPAAGSDPSAGNRTGH